ncbi:hypothetical protein GGR51DRAFT_160316 [Nemania sp. FL0031]|nr:hypothetical protein GGR51DRAFT_160316 [Nemania sp. FL0031]
MNRLAQPFRISRQCDGWPIIERQTRPHNHGVTRRILNFSTTRSPHRTLTFIGNYYFHFIYDETAAIAASSTISFNRVCCST